MSPMPEKTCFCCPKCWCWKMVTSDSWRLKHIKLHYPEQLQVAHQKYLTICSAPRRVETAVHGDYQVKNDSVEDLDVFPYLEPVEIIADMESQIPPPPLLLTEIYPSAGIPLSDYIVAAWKRDAQGCLWTNLQNNHYYPFGMCEECKYIQCGIKKKCMKR